MEAFAGQCDSPNRGSFEMSATVENLVEGQWDRLDADFTSAAVDGAKAAQMRCDVVVMDGNAKNIRAVCAAPFMQFLTDPRLRKAVRTGCARTPQLGRTCCRQHESARTATDAGVDLEIIDHKAPLVALQSDAAVDFMLLVREIGGAGREVWVTEQLLEPRAVVSYLLAVGDDQLAQQVQKRSRARKLLPHEELPPLPSLAKDPSLALLALASAPDDLAAVACGTHKEAEALQRSLARTAGVLCAVLSSGIVILMREMYGSESLSQRYLFISKVVDVLPDVSVLIHDDACHTSKFCSKRADESIHAARLAPPNLQHICDPFHMAGHTDAWCREHCDPRSAANAPLMEGIRSSVCEFTFTWLSRYKHQSKHMNEWGFKFFLLEMMRSHNDVIFRGGYRPTSQR